MESFFTDPLLSKVGKAGSAAWCKTGVVTVYSGGEITATIDGASVTGIKKAAGYTPTVADVAIFLIVRGTKAVQYVAIDKFG